MNSRNRLEAPARKGGARIGERGFTLIELLIAVAIIGILAGIAVAQLRQTPQRAKEAVLKQDLFVLRDLLDQYFADKGKYPASLETLVDDQYIRRIPTDPFTESDQSWEEIYEEASDEDPEGGGGVYDIRSGATGAALDGSSYSDW